MAQEEKASLISNLSTSDILVGDSYLNFINSLKADSTKECYTNALMRFMKFFDIKDTQTLATLTPSEFEFYLKKYLEHQKQNNSSYNSMSMITNTVNHFCTNDIVINSRKISKFKSPTGNGKGRGQEHDEVYTREEIQKLLNLAPLRMKVCILVYASTGIRKGALASIKLRHLEKISDNENFYKITVYSGTRDQYITFTTPECSKTIDEYFDYRTRLGEELTPDSYLIREDFDITDIEQIKLKSRRISDRTISSGFYALSIKAGTRQGTSDKNNPNIDN